MFQTVHWIRFCAVYQWFVKYLHNEWVTQILDKERCSREQIFFELLYVSCIYFTSQVLQNCFSGMKFCVKFEVYYKNNFCKSLLLKSLEIRPFCSKLNSRKWGYLSSVFHRNSPKHGNDQTVKLDWNWLRFYGERNTGLCAITAPSYKQPSKLSRLQNTHRQLNLLTVTLLSLAF